MSEPDKDSPFHRFQRAGATEHQLQMLTAALNASPELNRDVTEAIRSRDLVRMNLLPADAAANGEYDLYYRDIRLKPDLLDADINNKQNIDKVIDVLAHEISHASRREEGWAFDSTMVKRAHEFVQTDGPRNWTGFVRDYIAYGRGEEAQAELDGVNTLADRIRHENKGPVTEAELAKRLFATSACVEQGPDKSFRFKSGITFDPDTQSVQPSAGNLEAIAKYHFDSNPHYRHHYAAGAISKIADRELAFRADNPLRPIMDNQVNLTELKLDAETLRKGSFQFESNEPFQFADTSRAQRQMVEIRGNRGRSRSPELHEEQEREVAKPASRSPVEPSHPDHELLEILRGRVRGMDQQVGKGWDEKSERLSASALVMAKGMGFTAEDDPQLTFNRPSNKYAAGEILHLSRQGPNVSNDPAANRAYMTTAEALSKPVEERYRQVDDINLTQERAQAMQLAQQQTIGPDDPSRGGPVMRM